MAHGPNPRYPLAFFHLHPSVRWWARKSNNLPCLKLLCTSTEPGKAKFVWLGEGRRMLVLGEGSLEEARLQWDPAHRRIAPRIIIIESRNRVRLEERRATKVSTMARAPHMWREVSRDRVVPSSCSRIFEGSSGHQIWVNISLVAVLSLRNPISNTMKIVPTSFHLSPWIKLNTFSKYMS